METNGTIELVHSNDKMFAGIAQGAIVTGATLPSGTIVPSSGHWVIQGHAIVNVVSSGLESMEPE